MIWKQGKPHWHRLEPGQYVSYDCYASRLFGVFCVFFSACSNIHSNNSLTNRLQLLFTLGWDCVDSRRRFDLNKIAYLSSTPASIFGHAFHDNAHHQQRVMLSVSWGVYLALLYYTVPRLLALVCKPLLLWTYPSSSGLLYGSHESSRIQY